MQIINSNYVEITNKCNLNCSFCFHKKSENIINNDVAIKFAIGCSEENGRLVIFGGEPFLEIEKVYSIVKAFSIGLSKHNTYGKVVIVTNGTIYNEELVDRIIKIRKEMPSSGFSISFDGCEKVHSANRPFVSGLESYTAVVSNIRKYKEYINSLSLVNDRDKKNVFSVQFVFSPQVIENIDDVISVTKAFRHEGIYTSELLMNDECYNELNFELAEEAISKLFKAFDGEGGNSYRLFSCDKAISSGFDLNSVKFCTIGRYYHSFTPDGGIYPCSHFYHNEFDSFKLGSILDGTYNSRLAEVIYSMKRSSKCSSCETGGRCTGYCVANNIIHRKKHDSLNENVCNLNKIYVREHNIHNPIGGKNDI